MKLSQVNIPLLMDVTIRDGGYLNDWKFDDRDILNIITALSQCGIDYIEVGYLSHDKSQPISLQCPLLYLKKIKDIVQPSTKVAAMLRTNVPDIHTLLEDKANYLDMVRIPTTEENLKDSLEICALCHEFGIATSVNIISMTSFSIKEVLNFVKKVAACKAVDVLYLADSRGALIPSVCFDLYKAVRKIWNKPLGFHGHNNLNLSIANTTAALDAGVDFVDSSINGYSLGGGNVNTSELINFLQPKRPDLQCDANSLNNLIRLANPPHLDPLYFYSGKKNLEQEWVPFIWEEYGQASIEFMQQLPDNALNKSIEIIKIGCI